MIQIQKFISRKIYLSGYLRKIFNGSQIGRIEYSFLLLRYVIYIHNFFIYLTLSFNVIVFVPVKRKLNLSNVFAPAKCTHLKIWYEKSHSNFEIQIDSCRWFLQHYNFVCPISFNFIILIKTNYQVWTWLWFTFVTKHIYIYFADFKHNRNK